MQPRATGPSSPHGCYLSNEVLVLLHELVQVILVLVDALQQVRSLELQPVQLLVHLVGGRTRVRVRQNGGWEGD